MSEESDSLEVLCIGEALAVLHTSDEWDDAVRPQFHIRTGGAESNVALHLAVQGIEAGWFSRVGDDPFGRMVTSDLAKAGVDVSRVAVDAARPTGMYVKDVTGDGAAVMHYHRAGSAASHLRAEDLERLPIGLVSWVHISGITTALSHTASEMVDALFDACKAAGTQVSFDVNFRPRLWERDRAAVRLRHLAQRSDLVLVGRDEAEDLWGTRSPQDVFDHLNGPRLIVVKDAGVGATELDRSTRLGQTFVATPPVDVVELIGAGDAFAGGYLAGLIRGESSHRRLMRGHESAGWTIGSSDDARPGHVARPFCTDTEAAR